MSELKRAIVITGSNGGIGQAMSSVFTREGYTVIGVDLFRSDECSCERFIEFDLAHLASSKESYDHLQQILDKVSKEFTLIGLINNAAVQYLDHLEDINLVDFQKTLNINVSASLALSQILLPFLEESQGSIINIGSIHSTLTKPKFISYATSKAALRGLTIALSVDVGDRVRCNLIEPAATSTEMLNAGFVDDPQSLQSLKDFHPVGRIADPVEIAEMSLFLVSDKCTFANGAVIRLDGGVGSCLHDPC